MSSIKGESQDVVRPARWWEALPRPIYAKLRRVKSRQPWFEVYKIEPDIFVFYKPGQFEEALSYMVLGTTFISRFLGF
jgi:hypothetical protein